MIIDEFIRIKVKGCRKIKYFESIGYDIDSEFIDIKISDMTPGSREIINTECDYCGEIKKATYKEYLRNIKNGNKYSCSKKCGSEKAKETNISNIGVENHMMLKSTREKTISTNLERYGVEYPQQSESIRQKSKETLISKYGVDHISKTDHFKKKSKDTNLERHGVEYPQQSESIRQKSKETLISKYGVDNPSKSMVIRDIIEINNLDKYGVKYPQQLMETKEKTKKSNLMKYGVDNPSKLDEIKEKIKETNLERYGVDSPIKLDEIKEKIKETNLERYGVDNPLKSKRIRNKIKETNLERYGSEVYMESIDFIEKSNKTLIDRYKTIHISRNEEYRKNNYIISSDINYIKYLENGISLFNCDKKHTFEISSDNYYHRIESDIPLCTICNPIGDSKSIKERELYGYIKSIYSDEIKQSYRDGLEIDIYLPDLNIGFEFNGLYWHSDKFRDKYYHINKTNHFKERGISLIHIWEDDWSFRKDIIKSQIVNWLGLTKNKIFARECVVKEIKYSKISSKFLNKNHIQGAVRSNIKLGLYHVGELVSIMTFDRLEGRNKMEDGGWNLNRFCNLLNTNVVGGASKLFKYFIRNYEVNRVISYADRDWSVGNLYNRLGFNLISESKPDYKYIIDKKRINKSRFRKSKTGVSESKLLIDRVWDCGKLKFEYIK